MGRSTTLHSVTICDGGYSSRESGCAPLQKRCRRVPASLRHRGPTVFQGRCRNDTPGTQDKRPIYAPLSWVAAVAVRASRWVVATEFAVLVGWPSRFQASSSRWAVASECHRGEIHRVVAPITRCCSTRRLALSLPRKPSCPGGTPRRRENWGGLPADAGLSLGREPVRKPGAGARPEGSRIVASSTTVRVSVPDQAPRAARPTRRGAGRGAERGWW
jgi:hypothetical protein